MLTRTSNVLPEVGRAHRRNGGANSLRNFVRKINKVTGLAYPPYAVALVNLTDGEVLKFVRAAGSLARSAQAKRRPALRPTRLRPPGGRIPDVAEAKLKMGNPIGLTDPLHRRHPWRSLALRRRRTGWLRSRCTVSNHESLDLL